MAENIAEVTSIQQPLGPNRLSFINLNRAHMKVAALVAAGSLLVASCSGNGDDNPDAADGGSAKTEETTTTTAREAAGVQNCELNFDANLLEKRYATSLAVFPSLVDESGELLSKAETVKLMREQVAGAQVAAGIQSALYEMRDGERPVQKITETDLAGAVNALNDETFAEKELAEICRELAFIQPRDGKTEATGKVAVFGGNGSMISIDRSVKGETTVNVTPITEDREFIGWAFGANFDGGVPEGEESFYRRFMEDVFVDAESGVYIILNASLSGSFTFKDSEDSTPVTTVPEGETPVGTSSDGDEDSDQRGRRPRQNVGGGGSNVVDTGDSEGDTEGNEGGGSGDGEGEETGDDQGNEGGGSDEDEGEDTGDGEGVTGGGGDDEGEGDGDGGDDGGDGGTPPTTAAPTTTTTAPPTPPSTAPCPEGQMRGPNNECKNEGGGDV